MTDLPGSRRARRANLKRLLTPRHIAFVGGHWVEQAIDLCRAAGFEGPLWAVNPKYPSLADLACFRSVEALPEAPDATLIALSPAATIATVQALAARGAGGAVSIAGGFAEIGPEGKVLQDRLAQAAGDVALIGPNGLGALNLFDGVAIWGANNLFERAASPGVAVVSQSGSLIYDITNIEEGFPLGYAISMGNQAVLDASDYIEVLLEDPRVGAIGLYLEGIVDVAALSAAAARAHGQSVPLVVLKSGGSARSAAVTVSHTGTLAVSNELWGALFTRLAMTEVHAPKAMVETLKLLGSPRRVGGPRLLFISFSGGYSAILLDHAARMGFELPQPTPAQAQALRAALPAGSPVSNPLDLNLAWAALADRPTIERLLESLLDEPYDGVVFFAHYPRPGRGVELVWQPTIDALCALAPRSRVPIVIASILPEGLPPALRANLAAAGIPALLGLDDTMTALAAGIRRGNEHWRVASRSPEAMHLPGPGPIPQNVRLLDEWESKQALTEFGLVVPPGAIGRSGEMPGLAAAIGFPVALKLVNAELAHKARAGGVRLGLANERAVADAVRSIVDSVSAYDPTLATEPFLVERMVADATAEIMVGIKREPGLGLALLIARGGADVERLRQYRLVLLPVLAAEIESALGQLGLSASEPRNGRRNLVAQIRAVIAFAERHRDTVCELEVNPIVVTSSGEAIAVDALIRIGTGFELAHREAVATPPHPDEVQERGRG